MAQIKIKAELDNLKKQGIRNYTCFRDKNGKRFTAEPIVGKKTAAWLVPDTDYNREVFLKDFEPSGIFSAEDINQKTPEPFRKGKGFEGKSEEKKDG